MVIGKNEMSEILTIGRKICVKCGWVGRPDKFNTTEKGNHYCKEEELCVDRIAKTADDELVNWAYSK